LFNIIILVLAFIVGYDLKGEKKEALKATLKERVL